MCVDPGLGAKDVLIIPSVLNVWSWMPHPFQGSFQPKLIAPGWHIRFSGVEL